MSWTRRCMRLIITEGTVLHVYCPCCYTLVTLCHNNNDGVTETRGECEHYGTRIIEGTGGPTIFVWTDTEV